MRLRLGVSNDFLLTGKKLTLYGGLEKTFSANTLSGRLRRYLFPHVSRFHEPIRVALRGTLENSFPS